MKPEEMKCPSCHQATTSQTHGYPDFCDHCKERAEDKRREREEVDRYTATLKNGVNPVRFGTRTYGGLTKREHFAGLAMQALISRNAEPNFKKRVELAVKYAEALIEELEKSK